MELSRAVLIVSSGSQLLTHSLTHKYTADDSNWTGMKSRQLWYAHYDNNPSFSDFSSFGGWTKPAIKQYAGTTGICGTSIDKDYY